MAFGKVLVGGFTDDMDPSLMQHTIICYTEKRIRH